MSPLYRKIALACLLVLLAVAASYGGLFIAFFTTQQTPPATVVIEVKPGSSFTTVARKLYQEKVISDLFYFRVMAKLSGAEDEIKAGEYYFSKPATPGEILDRLVVGDVRRYRVTIPEGFNLMEIGDRFEAAGITSAEKFMELATDPDFLKTQKIDATSLEGYLFPETYTYISGTPVEKLLASMVEQFRQRLKPEVVTAAQAHGLDPHQLVILASIVQKEAGNNDEMPLIAAVFLNRLEKRIPLQADPTVIYGLGRDFDGNITRAHLRMPTPYNTYTQLGLPAGPITCPGEIALQAVAFPADVKYLYFVARGDGTHIFSHTLKEHNKAVRKYQLKQ
jgi:UPF0755 protein